MELYNLQYMLHKSQWGAGGVWTPTPEFQPSYTRPIFSSLFSPHFSLSPPPPPPPQKKKKKKKKKIRIYAFAEKKTGQTHLYFLRLVQ